jgi:hypothetical protein
LTTPTRRRQPPVRRNSTHSQPWAGRRNKSRRTSPGRPQVWSSHAPRRLRVPGVRPRRLPRVSRRSTPHKVTIPIIRRVYYCCGEMTNYHLLRLVGLPYNRIVKKQRTETSPGTTSHGCPNSSEPVRPVRETGAETRLKACPGPYPARRRNSETQGQTRSIAILRIQSSREASVSRSFG